MKKKVEKKSRVRAVILVLLSIFVFFFIIIPVVVNVFDGNKFGNVALIPVEGIITGSGGSSLGQQTLSSRDIVNYIEAATESKTIKVIVLEINSPGGSAVASDEIAAAIKKSNKPVISYIREVGASGGYWIASATDHIIANRMSITGSIGVISSYLEFSGLMEEYGVGYERLVAGAKKDIGTPFRKLKSEEKDLLQKKLDKIHDYFVQEISLNRNMSINKVRSLATGEFFLGVEAKQNGLIDLLGNKDTVEEYLKEEYHLSNINYVTYQREVGLLEILTGVFSDFFFKMGQGISSVFIEQQNIALI
jgi:protease IV